MPTMGNSIVLAAMGLNLVCCVEEYVSRIEEDGGVGGCRVWKSFVVKF